MAVLFLIPEIVPGAVALVPHMRLQVALQGCTAVVVVAVVVTVVVVVIAGRGLKEACAWQDGSSWRTTRTGIASCGITGECALLFLLRVALLQRICGRCRRRRAERMELHLLLLVLMLVRILSPQFIILAHKMIVDHNAIVGIRAGRL